MKVHQLQQLLNTLPQNADVYVFHQNDQWAGYISVDDANFGEVIQDGESIGHQAVISSEQSTF